jgi:hypothetical protein
MGFRSTPNRKERLGYESPEGTTPRGFPWNED